MGISDLIASFLQESLEETDGGVLEVQRNDLAQRFNCVPSQINYVMSTRFSPERGYIVESRRGGNGYIRITRVRVDRQTLLMQVINTLGSQVDLSVYAARRKAMAEVLREAGYDFQMPAGAFYFFPKAPGGDDVAFVNQLLEERVLAVPGSGFGCPGYFRLAFCVDESVIRNAADGFAKARAAVK